MISQPGRLRAVRDLDELLAFLRENEDTADRTMDTARYTDLTGNDGGLHVPAALVARRPRGYPPFGTSARTFFRNTSLRP